MEKKKASDGCLRCNRRLKRPSPDGLGPVCRKKKLLESGGATAQTETPSTDGQIVMFPVEKARRA